MKVNELVEGVEYNRSDSDFIYKVDKHHVLYSKSSENAEWKYSIAHYNSIIEGHFTEREFKPKLGERYYFPTFMPDIIGGFAVGYDYMCWEDDNYDNNIRRCVGVYRTKEQAIEKARELGWLE